MLRSLIAWPRAHLGYRKLREPKARGHVAYHEESADEVQASLQSLGIAVTPLRADPVEYQQYLRGAEYDRFPKYYAVRGPSFAEKSFEHFLAAQLLALQPGGVYVDVASDTSPTPDIYSRMFGVTAYTQDLRYAPGVNGRRIGGDAAAMPVPDEFADGMALHCSFEHFEGDSDSRFIAECVRVLRPGGRVCILPLYLSNRYSIMTDLGSFARRTQPDFEPDATVYHSRGWGQRHGRFYDAAHLRDRILGNAAPLRATVFRVVNLTDISASCYAHFVLLLEKPA